jgi:hypothetical protein
MPGPVTVRSADVAVPLFFSAPDASESLYQSTASAWDWRRGAPWVVESGICHTVQSETQRSGVPVIVLVARVVELAQHRPLVTGTSLANVSESTPPGWIGAE